MKPLAIQKAHLIHFKNYQEAQFTFNDRFNLISGRNGAGKTNLLDAIYYLSVGKSYFTQYDQRVVKHGEDFFRLESEIRRDEEQHEVVFKVQPGKLKEIEVDHVHIARISEHVGFIPIVFSAPRDIDLVTGGSQSRRRYLDHLLCQVDAEYLQALMEYNYLLQLRGAALKGNMADLRRVIATYDERMAPQAHFIYEKRKWLTGVFTPLLHESYHSLAGGHETVSCRYESQLHDQRYEVLTDRNWEQDKNSQRNNFGIHKDDFAFEIKSMSAKEYASQGQIKSLIFSMHLAKYNLLRELKGFNPVLVLDDIFDKLDDQRLARLMDILNADDFGQIFISDTNRDRLRGNLKAEDVMEIVL